MADHMAVVARRRGKPAIAEKPPPLPHALAWVWSDFTALAARRQVNMTAQPITHQELAAYQAVTGNRLPPWAVDIMFQLDDLWLSTVAEHSKKGQPRQ